MFNSIKMPANFCKHYLYNLSFPKAKHSNKWRFQTFILQFKQNNLNMTWQTVVLDVLSIYLFNTNEHIFEIESADLGSGLLLF